MAVRHDPPAMARLAVCAAVALVLVIVTCAPVAEAGLSFQVRRDSAKHTAQGRALAHKRQLQVFDGADVYGPFSLLAYFYVDVYLGTPPQRGTVIVDTGSTLLALPCTGCTTCGQHTDPQFDAGASSTAKFVTCADHPGVRCDSCSNDFCHYTVGYAEGSHLAGTYVEDVTWVGSDGSDPSLERALGIPFLFGCHTAESGLFPSQVADGIMGLGPSDNTLIAQLEKQGMLDNYMFSLCLTPEGGIINIGDYNASLHAAPLQSVRFSSSKFYQVAMSGVQVTGGRAISPSGGMHAIVDSGTSFSYLPHSVYTQIKNDITNYCNGGADRCKGTPVSEVSETHCYSLESPEDLATFPSLALLLDGAEWVVPPEGLFQSMTWFTNPSHYCLGVYGDSGSSAVIGANAMMYHDVVFDLGTRFVRFAPSQCAGAPTGSDLRPGVAHWRPRDKPAGEGASTQDIIEIASAAILLVAVSAAIGTYARSGCKCGREPQIQFQRLELSQAVDSHPPPGSRDALASDDEDGEDGDTAQGYDLDAAEAGHSGARPAAESKAAGDALSGPAEVLRPPVAADAFEIGSADDGAAMSDGTDSVGGFSSGDGGSSDHA